MVSMYHPRKLGVSVTPFAGSGSQHLIQDAVSEFARATRFPLAFGGYESDGVTAVTAVEGARGGRLSDLRVANTRGLGGRAMIEHRPRFTPDYMSSRLISHDYDAEIASEGIVMLIAVPVVVNGLTRAVLYGGTRGGGAPDGTFMRAAAGVVRDLEREILIEDEVQLRMLRTTPREPRGTNGRREPLITLSPGRPAGPGRSAGSGRSAGTGNAAAPALRLGASGLTVAPSEGIGIDLAGGAPSLGIDPPGSASQGVASPGTAEFGAPALAGAQFDRAEFDGVGFNGAGFDGTGVDAARFRTASPGSAARPAGALTAVTALTERGITDAAEAEGGAAVTLTEHPSGIPGAVLEELRSSHAELRSIAADTQDPRIRSRLAALEQRLAGIGRASAPPSDVRLTPRETDVIAHAAIGASNAGIGAALGLTESTVKSYLKTAMSKLKATTRHAAVAAARGHGIIP